MTLLSTQPKCLESAPVSAVVAIEDPEQRMLEKRSKVIEELLQTEKDYIKDLQMCVKEIIQPLQRKQVHTLLELVEEDNWLLQNGDASMALAVRSQSP